MKYLLFFCVSTCALVSGQLYGQSERWSRQDFGISVAWSIINEKMPEGYYQPVIIRGTFGWNLGKTTHLDDKRGHFIGYLEPQINPVWVSGRLQDLEFGCNFGIRYEYEANELNRFYWAIGTGPHFITVNTSMQARGYIFSDNFILGWRRKLHGPIYSNVQYKFRHISNAGLMKPNIGIDNHFISLGFSKVLNP